MTEQGRIETEQQQQSADLDTRSVVDVNAEAEQPQATEDAQVAHPASSVGHDVDNAPVVQDVTQEGQSESLFDRVIHAGSAVAHKVSEAASSVAEKVGEAVAPVTEKVSEAAQAVADKVDDVKADVSAAASDVKAEASDAAEAVATKVDDVKAEAGEVVSDVKAEAGDAAEAVAAKVDDVKADAGEVVSDVKAEAGEAVQAVAAKVDDVKADVHAAASDVKAEAGDAAEAVAAQADDVKADVHAAASDVKAEAGDAAEAVATKVDDVKADVHAAVSDVKAEAGNAAEAVAAKVDDVKAEAGDAAHAVSAKVDDAAGIVAPAAAEASYDPEQAEDGHPRRVKDLTSGMELQGRVTSIALYGVFVDIGVGRDGLVHISEMSDTRIDSPSDIVKIGDTITVRVKSVDPDGRRISLTMRNKERSSEPRHRPRKKSEINREALAALRVGDNISGTITGVSNFGVFVDIGVGKDGLVHVSELAEGRVEKPEDVVAVGETHTFKILEVDADGARISLSLRRAQRTQRLQQLEKGQIVEGTISGIAPFGAFIDIGVGRDGLVHISELSEGRVNKVEDAVKVGDKVMVRVLEVDPQNKRISLTLRLEDKPREAAPREDRPVRPAREDRGPRPPRADRSAQAPREPEVYSSTSDEPEEGFSGDATIEDLLSKYGSNKRDRRRRADDDEEDSEDRGSRRQRDAIRRTLQHMDDE